MSERTEEQEHLLKIYRRSKADPVWWARNVINENPWKAQRCVLRSVRDNPETTVSSSHAVGKSWLASRSAQWFHQHHKDSFVVITAPTQKQVNGIIFREIHKTVPKYTIPLRTRPLESKWVFNRGWEIVGMTARDTNPDAFVGFHAAHILVIVDEAAGVSNQLYEAIESLISTGNARLLLIGNPTRPTGHFADSHKPKSSAKRFKISSFDTPNFTTFGITIEDILEERRRDALAQEGKLPSWEAKIAGRDLPCPWLVTPAWVAKIIKRLGVDSPYVRSRILAEFPDASDDQVFPLSMIAEAMANDVEPSNPACLGVDVARFGGNENVIYERRGNRYRLHSTFFGKKTFEITGRVKSALTESGAQHVNVDEGGGYGAATIDDLAADGLPVYGVLVGTPATDPSRFINLRAEMLWTLREEMERGEVDLDPTDVELHDQLARLRYEYDKRGRIQIESKDKYRKRYNGESPDRADALMLTRAPPVLLASGVDIV